MARSSEQVTQQEVAAYQQWCRTNLVIWSNNQNNPNVVGLSNHNANVVAKYFQETWPNDITQANLDLAMPQLRSQLNFFDSKLEQRFDQVTLELSTREYDVLGTWFEKQPLLINEGDQGMSNLLIVLEIIRGKGRDINADNLNLMLANGYVTNQPKVVYWKRGLQAYEKEQQRQKAESNAVQVDRTAETAEQRRKQRLYELQLGLTPQR
jgi:hypothetical protein